MSMSLKASWSSQISRAGADVAEMLLEKSNYIAENKLFAFILQTRSTFDWRKTSNVPSCLNSIELNYQISSSSFKGVHKCESIKI